MQNLVRHLIKKEIAIKDIVNGYAQSGLLLLEDLVKDYNANKQTLTCDLRDKLVVSVKSCKDSQTLTGLCIHQLQEPITNLQEKEWAQRQEVLRKCIKQY